MTSFKSPVRYAAGAATRSRFAGMPVGVELLTDYYVFDPFALISDTTIPNATAATAGLDWTTTAVNASTIAASDDSSPAYVVLTTAGAENDGVQAQYTAASGAGEFFSLRAGKIGYFSCRFSLGDVAGGATAVQQNDLFMGMAITDTTVLGGATDFIGFHKIDGSGVVNFVAGKNASTSGLLVDQIVSPMLTLVAADGGAIGSSLGVNHSFSFVAVGTTEVHLYADGAYKTTVRSTTQLPDDENLCPTMALLTGEATAKLLFLRKFIAAIEL